MTTCVYDMKMPVGYVELTTDEMEYDGGFVPLVIVAVGIGLSLGGTGVSAYGMATDNNTLIAVGIGMSIVGTVMSFGGGLASLSATTALTATGAALRAGSIIGGAGLSAFSIPFRIGKLF
jgi:hypothetical protein